MMSSLKLPGFFGSSYVCADCWKPYNTEGRHRCTKTKLCGACRQKDCPDFQHAYPRHLKATQRCKSCHRDFFGPACFEAHSSKTHAGKPTTDLQASVCSQRYRCPDCYQQNVGFVPHSTSPLFPRGLPFLSSVRPRRQPPLFYSKSPQASRRKEEKEDPSKRSSRQTRCRRRGTPCLLRGRGRPASLTRLL